MDRFPYEIILEIFNFIEMNEILQISLTCRGWRNIMNMDYFWKRRLEFDFGIEESLGRKKDESHQEIYKDIYSGIIGTYYNDRRMNVYVEPNFFFQCLEKNKVKKAINPASRLLIARGRFKFNFISVFDTYREFVSEMMDYLLKKPSIFQFYFFRLDSLNSYITNLTRFESEIRKKIEEKLNSIKNELDERKKLKIKKEIDDLKNNNKSMLVLPRIIEMIKSPNKYILTLCRFNQTHLKTVLSVHYSILHFLVIEILESKEPLSNYFLSYTELTNLVLLYVFPSFKQNEENKVEYKERIEMVHDIFKKIIDYIISNAKDMNTRFLSSNDFCDDNNENISLLELSKSKIINEYRSETIEILLSKPKVFRFVFQDNDHTTKAFRYMINRAKNPEKRKEQIFEILVSKKNYFKKLIHKIVPGSYKPPSIFEFSQTKEIFEIFDIIDEPIKHSFNSNPKQKKNEDYIIKKNRSKLGEIRRQRIVNLLFGVSHENDFQNPRNVKKRVEESYTDMETSKILMLYPSLKKNFILYSLRSTNKKEYDLYFPKLESFFSILNSPLIGQEKRRFFRNKMEEHIEFRIENDGIFEFVRSTKLLIELRRNFGNEICEDLILKKLIKKPVEFIKLVKNYKDLNLIFSNFEGFRSQIHLQILKKKKLEQRINKSGKKQFRKNFRSFSV